MHLPILHHLILLCHIYLLLIYLDLHLFHHRGLIRKVLIDLYRLALKKTCLYQIGMKVYQIIVMRYLPFLDLSTIQRHYQVNTLSIICIDLVYCLKMYFFKLGPSARETLNSQGCSKTGDYNRREQEIAASNSFESSKEYNTSTAIKCLSLICKNDALKPYLGLLLLTRYKSFYSVRCWLNIKFLKLL